MILLGLKISRRTLDDRMVFFLEFTAIQRYHATFLGVTESKVKTPLDFMTFLRAFLHFPRFPFLYHNESIADVSVVVQLNFTDRP